MSRVEARVDLHVHSRYSTKDSLTLVYQLEEARQERGLSHLAITDHNTLGEAPKTLRKLSGFPFILGEEILTTAVNPNGKNIEIVGIFLKEAIPAVPCPTLEDTIYGIGAQGGMVIIPHPFEGWRHGAGEEMSLFIVDECRRQKIPVACEVFNARARSPRYNLRARNFWQERLAPMGVLATAGSDAHRKAEVGNAYVSMKPWATLEEFRENLGEGIIHGNSRQAGWHRTLNRIEILLGRPLEDFRESLRRGLLPDSSDRE